jgi:hypothetical protein
LKSIFHNFLSASKESEAMFIMTIEAVGKIATNRGWARIIFEVIPTAKALNFRILWKND